jgi:hypothetical protein
MSDGPGVSVDRSFGSQEALGDKWSSFEARMRGRRLEKCLQRADLAIANGSIQEARCALDEAQRLAPGHAAAAILEQRVRALQRDDRPRPIRQRSLRRVPAPVSAVVLLIGAAGAVFAASYWYVSPPSRPSSTTAAASLEDSSAGGNAGSAAAPPAVDRLRIVRETIAAPVATPRILDDAPGLPTGQPIAEAAVPLYRQPPALPAPQPGADLELEPLTPLAAPPPPAISSSPAATAAPAPAPSRAHVPVAESASAGAKAIEEAGGASPARDELSVVLGVLQRYEVAYSRLDAAAAAAVWPRVNRNALARAFEGLASQRVSLGRCDVAVNGPAARASCSGSATWEPKVGGGRRTEPRHWDFELRKSGSAWWIERAVAGSSDH